MKKKTKTPRTTADHVYEVLNPLVNESLRVCIAGYSLARGLHVTPAQYATGKAIMDLSWQVLRGAIAIRDAAQSVDERRASRAKRTKGR